jgi:hypothetical protein
MKSGQVEGGKLRRHSLRRRTGRRNRAIRSAYIDQGEQGQAKKSCEELEQGLCFVHAAIVMRGCCVHSPRQA